MVKGISLARFLEIGLALIYGAILGSRLPLPEPAAIFAMPAVAAAPVPLLGTVGPADPALADEVRPAAQARTPRDTGAGSRPDTLPAAPLRTVLQVAAPAENTGGTGALRSGKGGSACIGVEGADDASCRSAVRARLRTLCPKPDDLTHRGPVVCLREED